jgi:chromosomal replication initiation ATPase DnaA
MIDLEQRLRKIEEALGIIKDEVSLLRGNAEMVKDLREQAQPASEAVMSAVEAVFQRPVAESFVLRDQSPAYVEARHVVIVLLYELRGLSASRIARQFGIHHTSVLHARRSIARRLEQGDAELADKIERVKQILRGTAAPIATKPVAIEIARRTMRERYPHEDRRREVGH